MIDKRLSSQANQALVKEMLDIVANDSENLERTLQWITDNCVWVMEPGGTEYHGFEHVNAFVGVGEFSHANCARKLTPANHETSC